MVGLSLAGRRGRPLGGASAGLLLGLLALCGAFTYDYLLAGVYLVPAWEWDPTRVEWLFGFSALVVGYTVGAPALADAGRYRERARDRPGLLVGLAVLALFALAGTVGPLAVGEPELAFLRGYQPPAFASVDADVVAQCLGRTANGRCHGTLAHPLGTNSHGYDVLGLLVGGARSSLYVAVIATALVVTVGTGVGAVAGYYGGVVDAALMRYVDVQQTVPAVVVYVVSILVFGKGLFLLVLVFGLFSWGGLARLVRSEVLQRRDAAYVLAAEAVGATPAYVLRRHILPNVRHATVTAFGQLVPVLLVTEAALAYLGLASVDQLSWGTLIAGGLGDESVSLFEQWWVSTAGVVALAGTVVAFKLVGDGLRDALDPRE